MSQMKTNRETSWQTDLKISNQLFLSIIRPEPEPLSQIGR